MNDWFRSWHGAPTDPKWRTVARRAGVRPGDVAAVAWVLFDRASQAPDRGSIAGYDAEVIADALGYEPDEVQAIISAMEGKGVIVNGRLAAWDKYQPKREREQDDSADRVREHRAKKRHVTPCNASETQETPREDKTRGDERESTARATSFPDGWKPEEPDLDEVEFARYRADRIAKGIKRVDWPADWQVWKSRIADYGKATAPKAQGPPPPPQTWIGSSDPRWSGLCERAKAERGKPLSVMTLQSKAEPGNYVPSEWLAQH